MADNNESVDTTVDPAQHSKGTDADPNQSSGERSEAIKEFDSHMDGSGGEPKLPTPDPEDVTDEPTDPKTTTRQE